MSRNGTVRTKHRNDAAPAQEEDEAEEEETEDENEEEEEEDHFYESLDRIASSSCSCSCSASNSDSDPDPSHPCSDGIAGLPLKFPSGYDVWISEPAPVSERRQRLLHQMGLVSGSDGNVPDGNRSVSSVHLTSAREERKPDPGQSAPSCSYSHHPSGFVRSKSAGADRVNDDGAVDFNSCAYFSTSSSLSNFQDSNNVNSGNGQCQSSDISSGNVENSRKSTAVSPNKPPTGKFGKRVDGPRKSNENFNGNCSNCSSSGELAVGLDGSVSGLLRVGEIADGAQVCRIKDLDNGKEFVVNEVKEDGTWNKLREVGTGRQLTIEEFEMSVGHSPIVQELMRRQNGEVGNRESHHESNGSVGVGGVGLRPKKKGGWFRSFRSVTGSVKGHKERRSSDERDTGSDKGGRRSSSATDDSQDVSFHGPERVRVKQYGKSFKELSALYKSQEIQAHNGSIWSIKFSLDGRYLASAGEDCVIHIWQVVKAEGKGELLMDKHEDGNFSLLLIANGSPERSLLSPTADSYHEKKRRGRPSISRKSLSLDHIFVPETVFALTDKPVCTFEGHHNDVLDLSWSKSQHLLSSSMDKTVRLWHLSSKTCLKVFSHSDYVTCIQFNPVDDRYFISGSLDAKVRIWSIPDRQVVDWKDLHEMVTAACYTPDGQGALVGSYKGSCRLYSASENKLLPKYEINLQNKKKKAHLKKITGFQVVICNLGRKKFAPGSSSEVLVTAGDSRIRVVDGADLVHKFKGFHNANSQISASVTANGKYVVSASEDSYVYVWKHEAESQPSRSKSVTVTRSYEHFHCQDVSVAIPWPGMCDTWGPHDNLSGEQNGHANHFDEISLAHHHPSTPVEDVNSNESSEQLSKHAGSPLNGIISSATNGYFFDRISATWPEEKLTLAPRTWSPRASVDLSNGLNPSTSAHGVVIVTAGLRGEIRIFQNFGLPVRI